MNFFPEERSMGQHSQTRMAIKLPYNYDAEILHRIVCINYHFLSVWLSHLGHFTSDNSGQLDSNKRVLRYNVLEWDTTSAKYLSPVLCVSIRAAFVYVSVLNWGRPRVVIKQVCLCTRLN